MPAEVLRAWFRIGLLCFLVVLLCGHSGAAEQRLKIVVRDLAVKQVPSEDPEISKFRIDLGMRLTNVGDQVVDVGAHPVLVAAVQFRNADGTWKFLVQNTLVWQGKQDFDPCTSLSPGDTTLIRNAQTGLALLHERVRELGVAPTLRFRMQFICRQRDGKDYNTDVFTTDPFVLRFPTPDPK